MPVLPSDLQLDLPGRTPQIPYDELPQSRVSGRFCHTLLEEGWSPFIGNAHNAAAFCRVGGQLLPLVIGRQDSPRPVTYLSSGLSQYIDYTREEVLEGEKYSRRDKLLAGYGFRGARKLLERGQVDEALYINNWMLATNLWPPLDPTALPPLVEKLAGQFPGKALVFRSVCPGIDPQLYQQLRQTGCRPIACRQVYLMDPAQKRYKKKRPYQQDKKRWKKTTRYYWDQPNQLRSGEADTVVAYYQSLYLEKYSALNPAYTPRFVREAIEGDLLDFLLLRDQAGQLQGVQALSWQNGVLTTPFIGYNQKLPREEGLYRFMNYQLMEMAIEGELLFHMSSGAASFKKQRGGQPHLEYNLVYDRHLPFWRRWPWQSLEAFSNRVVAPAMQEYEV